MKKDFNFKTAFAMRCDAKQFESVRKELEGMGYVIILVNGRYLCTNYADLNFQAGLSDGVTFQKNLIIETFNRNLCLALAAMTDKEDGIVGEWFKGSNGTFIQKKDDCDIASIATKATADELIKYFTEAKLEQKQPEPDPQIEALQKRIENLEYNVKQLAESVQKVKESEPQPDSIFADKQPIWAWDDGDAMFRRAGFWDAKNHYMFTCDGKRSGYLYDNYEPIPADQIPAWMVEAAKHLED